MSRTVARPVVGFGWGRCMTILSLPIRSPIRDPERSTISTPQARSMASSSRRRMFDGVGNAKTRSSTLRCLVLTTQRTRIMVLNQVPSCRGRGASDGCSDHPPPCHRRVDRPQGAPADSLPCQITGDRTDQSGAQDGRDQRDDAQRRKTARGTDPPPQHPPVNDPERGQSQHHGDSHASGLTGDARHRLQHAQRGGTARRPSQSRRQRQPAGPRHPSADHQPLPQSDPEQNAPIANAPTAASAAIGPRTLPTAPPTAMLTGRAKIAQIHPPMALARIHASHTVLVAGRRALLRPAPPPGS